MQAHSLKRITVITVSVLLMVAVLTLSPGCISDAVNTGNTLQWGDNIDQGISKAKADQKKVLIDFWGSG